MNKEIIELRKEVINLDEKVNNLSYFIRATEDFMEEKGEYYTFEESIKAINAMKTILDKRKKEFEVLCNNTQKMKRKFWNSCQHEILVKDELNNFCAICCSLIIYVPNTSVIQITVPSTHYLQQENMQKKIQEMIDKAIESDDLVGYVEEKLEELQFEEDISVRRLIK